MTKEDDKLKQHGNLTLLFAISMVAFVAQGHSCITPALASIGAAFPDVSETTLTLINTIPIFTSVPTSFLVGRIVGRKVSHKTLIMCGLSILFLSGVLSFFSRAFYQILILRALFGIGMGLNHTTLNDFILECFDHIQAKKQFGLDIIFANLGSVVLQILGGYLCLIEWRYAFLGYLVLIVPILTTVFLIKRKLPAKSENRPVEQNVYAEEKTSPMFPAIMKYCSMMALYFLAFYVFVNRMGILVAAEGYGTTADVGRILSVHSVAAMVGGFLFRRKLYRLNKVELLIGLFLSILGYFLVVFSNGLLMLYLSSVFFGCGFGIFSPALTFYGGTAVSSNVRSRMLSYLTIANNAGGFVSAYVMAGVIALIGTEYSRAHFVIAIVVFSILVGMVLMDLFKKNGSEKES